MWSILFFLGALRGAGLLFAFEQALYALFDGVGLLALGLELEVLVPVLDRLALLAGLLVGLPRRQVRLGRRPGPVALDLGGGGVGVPGLTVRSLPLPLVRKPLRLPLVDLTEVERYRGVVRAAVLDVEAGESLYDPWVLGVFFEFLLRLGPLLPSVVLLFFLFFLLFLLRATVKEIKEVVVDVRADAHKDKRAHEDHSQRDSAQAGPEGDLVAVQHHARLSPQFSWSRARLIVYQFLGSHVNAPESSTRGENEKRPGHKSSG